MRRVPAILLVFLFGFLLMGPGLFVDAEANLPACCRRDGSHHCAMMDMDRGEAPAPSSGPVVRARVARCAFYPTGGALLPHSGPALVAAAQPVHGPILHQLAVQAQAEAGYRVSLSRSHQKRGPPHLLS